jgi:hypothetical protein
VAPAPDYDIKPERAYGSYQDMIAAELRLPTSECVDFVSVATPNHTHFEIAKGLGLTDATGVLIIVCGNAAADCKSAIPGSNPGGASS